VQNGRAGLVVGQVQVHIRLADELFDLLQDRRGVNRIAKGGVDLPLRFFKPISETDCEQVSSKSKIINPTYSLSKLRSRSPKVWSDTETPTLASLAIAFTLEKKF